MATQAGAIHTVETHKTILGKCPQCSTEIGFVIEKEAPLPTELVITPHLMNAVAQCDTQGQKAVSRWNGLQPIFN